MPFGDGPATRGEVSRRDFLQGTCGAVGALALAPLALAPLRGPTEVRPALDPVTSTGSLDGSIRNHMQAAHLPSLGAALVHGGELHWSRGYGWANLGQDLEATDETDYMLASVSKTVTCAALMQVWEAGSCDLDADVNNYIPFEIHNPFFPTAKITPRMLLTHTSSIKDGYHGWGNLFSTPSFYCPGDSPVPLHDFLMDYLVPGGAYYVEVEDWHTEEPGTKYHYSNIGAVLAGYLVEAVTGTPFWKHCNDHIFTPLGMEQTGWHLFDLTTNNIAMPYRWHRGVPGYTPYFQYGYMDYPDGSLRTSAVGLSRWLRCFMNFGELEGVRILKRSTVEEVRRPQVPGERQGLTWCYQHYKYGLLLGHSGGDFGVTTQMFFDPARNIGTILLTNRYVGGWPSWYEFLDIQARLFQV